MELTLVYKCFQIRCNDNKFVGFIIYKSEDYHVFKRLRSLNLDELLFEKKPHITIMFVFFVVCAILTLLCNPNYTIYYIIQI